MKRQNTNLALFLGLLVTLIMVAPVALNAQTASAGTAALLATPVSGSQVLLRCDSSDGGQHLACENVAAGATVVSQQNCTSYPEYQCQQEYVNPANHQGHKLSKKVSASEGRQADAFSTSSGGPQLFLSY
ncbi:MAG TPA: hypothetical protein VEG30_16730 [Terriglobales bacterium]|nr:hypothetical protein [Terriglobales bacterium]